MKKFKAILNFALILFVISSTLCNLTCAFFEIKTKKQISSSSCHHSIIQNQKNQFIQDRHFSECDFLHKQLENYLLLNISNFIPQFDFYYKIKIIPQQVHLLKNHKVYFTYLYILFRVLRI